MEEVDKVEQEVGRVVQGPAAERKKPAVRLRRKVVLSKRWTGLCRRPAPKRRK